jgi:PhnB protein
MAAQARGGPPPKETSMVSVGTCLNFVRQTEAAFEFYRSVFGTELTGAVMRLGDAPSREGQPPLPEADRRLVMNLSLPILGATC